VRNPWDRLVSDWHWRRKGGLPLGDMPFPAFAARACDLVVSRGWDDDHVDRRGFSREYWGHFKPQVAYVGGDACVRLLRFETLSRDWERFSLEVHFSGSWWFSSPCDLLAGRGPLDSLPRHALPTCDPQPQPRAPQPPCMPSGPGPCLATAVRQRQRA